MDFNTYINTAEQINEVLNNEATKVRESIESRNAKNDYAKLEMYLNNIFYPENTNYGNDGKEYSEMLMTKLRNVYEKVSDKIITSGIGDETYKAVEKFPTLDDSDTAQRRKVRTLKSQYENVMKILNSLSETQNAKEIQNIVNQVESEYGKVLNVINDVISTYGDADNQFITKNFINKNGGNGEEVVKAIRGLSALYNTFNNAGLIILNTDYGNFLEYGLGLLSKDMDITAAETADSTLEYMQKNIVVGNKQVDRGGGILNLKLDASLTDGSSKDIKTAETNDKKAIQYTYENLTFTYDPSSTGDINTGTKKQGKVDVQLTLPDAMGGETFRISAKNWKTIDELHDLGNTFLLDAIHRTTSTEILTDYAFAMQNPKQTYVDVADNLAKLCIYADVAMGYSQKEGYADTLVVNDRSNSRIHVINIPQAIIDAVDNNLNKLKVKGYDVSVIQREAESARQLAMNVYRGGDRSQQYLAAFLNALRSIEVSVQFLNP